MQDITTELKTRASKELEEKVEEELKVEDKEKSVAELLKENEE